MTEKQEKFLNSLFGEAEGDPKRAMRMAGYSPNTSVSEVTDALADEIVARTKKLIASRGPQAAFTVFNIMEGKDLLGVKDKYTAAKDILDRANVKPSEKLEIESKTPLFILPAKEDKDAH